MERDTEGEEGIETVYCVMCGSFGGSERKAERVRLVEEERKARDRKRES